MDRKIHTTKHRHRVIKRDNQKYIQLVIPFDIIQVERQVQYMYIAVGEGMDNAIKNSKPQIQQKKTVSCD
jgi:hypothetical protein